MAPNPPVPPPPPAGNDYTASSLIAGIILSAVLLLCLLYLVQRQRSKANKKRSAAHFRVKGIIRPVTAETDPLSTSIPPFSRSRITASIVMPQKSITRKPLCYGLPDEKAGVLSDSTSKLALHLLPPNAIPSPTRPPVLPALNPAHPRHRRSSSGFSGYSQYRFSSGLSFRLSSASFAPLSQARLVHQSFEPTLSDELAPRYGEHLTVLRSFDDGWCIVARDTSRFSPASLLPGGTKHDGDNVDVGLVPAWVFSRPPEGVPSKRPFRNTSLNALHLGQNPVYRRDWVSSWSHFA